MLTITVPPGENYNEATNEFVYSSAVELKMEHSLVSISKWESIWHIPFLNDKPKTNAQILSYIKCMTITQNVSEETFLRVSSGNAKEIISYIDDPRTATWFSTSQDSSNSYMKNEQITSELIYYWMITFGIPFECQKWHLNRLLTLIRVCSIKNEPPKKINKSEIMKRNSALNAARRKKMKTRG
jgi:hypothetical protein